MEEKKTKSIKNIERRMEEMDSDSVRYRVLKCARDFKTSWIQLGQMLYTVWKDKLYKEWGYAEFDTYTSKEIGIRGQTSLKLLRSYSFLESKEPQYLKKFPEGSESPVRIPSYEAVDVLRKASSNNDITEGDYSRIRKYVLDDCRDAKDVKKDLTQLIESSRELDPQQAYLKKSSVQMKRLLSLLKSVEKEIRASRSLPEKITRAVNELIEMIEDQMPG